MSIRAIRRGFFMTFESSDEKKRLSLLRRPFNLPAGRQESDNLFFTFSCSEITTEVMVSVQERETTRFAFPSLRASTMEDFIELEAADVILDRPDEDVRRLEGLVLRELGAARRAA